MKITPEGLNYMQVTSALKKAEKKLRDAVAKEYADNRKKAIKRIRRKK